MSFDKSRTNSNESSLEVQSINEIEKPANWSSLRKWSIIVTATLITFMVSFASSVYSAVTSSIASEFNVSPQVSILGIVLYVAAFALGPMIWGPASELYDFDKYHSCQIRM
jgi:ammonia channel protein AmtB